MEQIFSPNTDKNIKTKDFLVLVFFSMALSFIYLQQTQSWYGININFQPTLDMKAYLNNAQGILNGSWPGTNAFFRAPLYSYILAIMIFIAKSLWGVMAIQAFIFSITVGIIYLTACTVFNRIIGWISALILLFYGGAFYWTAILHSTCFELFLSSLTFYFLLLSAKALNADKKIKQIIFLSVFTGFAFALLCLIRTNFLVIIPFFFIGFFIICYKQKKVKIFFYILLIFAIICFALWTPVAMHNYKYANTFFTTNAGLTWNNANTKNSGIFNAMVPQGKTMKVYSGNFWKHLSKKLIAFWSSPEYPQNVNYYLFRENIPILKFLIIPFGLISSLFILGLFFLRKEFNRLWPILAYFFPYYISISSFFIIGRFRIPSLPPMLIISSAFIYGMIIKVKEKKFKSLICYITILLFLFFISMPFRQVIKNYSYRGIAATALDSGNHNEAIKSLQKIKKMDIFTAEMLASSYYLNGNKRKALNLINAIETSTNKKYPFAKEYIKNKSHFNNNDIGILSSRLKQDSILFYIVKYDKRNNKLRVEINRPDINSPAVIQILKKESTKKATQNEPL